MTEPRLCPPDPGPLEGYVARFDDLLTRVAYRPEFREDLAGLLAPRDWNKTLTAGRGQVGSRSAASGVQWLQFYLSETERTAPSLAAVHHHPGPLCQDQVRHQGQQLLVELEG